LYRCFRFSLFNGPRQLLPEVELDLASAGAAQDLLLEAGEGTALGLDADLRTIGCESLGVDEKEGR
jgi:hypothetical protein